MRGSLPVSAGAAAPLGDYTSAGYWTEEILVDVLDRWHRETPEGAALLSAQGRVTWADLAQAAGRLAASFAGLGITKGDVVAVQLPNTVEFVTTYLAICMRGAVMQTVHMPYRSSELSFLLGHSRAKAFVCIARSNDFSAAETAVALQGSLPGLEHVIAVGEDVAGATSYADVVRLGGNAARAQVTAADPFLLLYTSGTTADPKGVPHSYRSFLCNSRLSARELEIEPGDVLLSLAPMTHLYGLFVFHLGLMAGATCVMLPQFSPPAFAEAVETHRATKIFAAPAHLQATLNMGLMDQYDFSSVHFICLSGSTVPPALARSVEEKLPNGRALQLWGMTELQAGAYSRMSDDASDRHYTAGRASPGTELRIADDSGEPSPPETDGRLQVRGPSLFRGYLGNDAATREALTSDGWFETGDTAKLTMDGHLILTGRVKEIINRGGVKFNPVDVETIIDAMPAVERSAIVPYADQVLGEKACVFVVSAAGANVALSDILATLEQAGVARIKWPERLEVVDAMPMTPTQKVMRARLVALLAEKDGSS